MINRKPTDPFLSAKFYFGILENFIGTVNWKILLFCKNHKTQFSTRCNTLYCIKNLLFFLKTCLSGHTKNTNRLKTYCSRLLLSTFTITYILVIKKIY